MKKIIVAGGGHGGIAVASMLAKRGFEVTVFERHPESGMGYDWTDIFAPGALAEIELPLPDHSLYEYKEHMTFKDFFCRSQSGIGEQYPPIVFDDETFFFKFGYNFCKASDKLA